MAGAFLSEALRQQAMQETRGQMLQGQIAKQVAGRIIGQIAQQKIGGSMQREQALGNTLNKAAGGQARRDVGRTQLEMQKEIGERQKMMGLIGSAASAAGALGAYFAMKPPTPEAVPRFDTPNTELALGDFSGDFVEGQQGQLVPGVSGELDTSVPQHFDQPLAAPDTNLALSKEYSTAPQESREFKTPEASEWWATKEDEEQWMQDLPLAPPLSGAGGLVDRSMEPDSPHPLEGSPRMYLKHPVPMGRDYSMDSDMRLIEELKRKGLL